MKVESSRLYFLKHKLNVLRTYRDKGLLVNFSLVNFYGKPDLFITMTCNPKWTEITENLESYETAIDRPDIAKCLK